MSRYREKIPKICSHLTEIDNYILNDILQPSIYDLNKGATRGNIFEIERYRELITLIENDNRGNF